MSQPDQTPTPQVPAGPLTGPQDEGGKGPHITITVQASTPSSEDTDDGGINLDGGKGPH